MATVVDDVALMYYTEKRFSIGGQGIDAIKEDLTLRIEEGFGLNSIHIAGIDGSFHIIHARAGAAYRSQHVTLKHETET